MNYLLFMGDSKLESIFRILWFLFIFWLGAVAHEADIARNCNEKGEAAYWFSEFKCVKDK